MILNLENIVKGEEIGLSKKSFVKKSPIMINEEKLIGLIYDTKIPIVKLVDFNNSNHGTLFSSNESIISVVGLAYHLGHTITILNFQNSVIDAQTGLELEYYNEGVIEKINPYQEEDFSKRINPEIRPEEEFNDKLIRNKVLYTHNIEAVNGALWGAPSKGLILAIYNNATKHFDKKIIDIGTEINQKFRMDISGGFQIKDIQENGKTLGAFVTFNNSKEYEYLFLYNSKGNLMDIKDISKIKDYPSKRIKIDKIYAAREEEIVVYDIRKKKIIDAYHDLGLINPGNPAVTDQNLVIPSNTPNGTNFLIYSRR